MADKSSFTPEEWSSLLQLPGVASMYIITASPAIGDSFKETMVLAKQIADPKLKESSTGLLKSVLAEFTDSSSAKQVQPQLGDNKDMASARATLLEKLRTGVALADAKAGDEAAEFKQWLYKIAVETAEAAKEGDFMGIGGEKVNQAERDALKQMADILGVQA